MSASLGVGLNSMTDTSLIPIPSSWCMASPVLHLPGLPNTPSGEILGLGTCHDRCWASGVNFPLCGVTSAFSGSCNLISSSKN